MPAPSIPKRGSRVAILFGSLALSLLIAAPTAAVGGPTLVRDIRASGSSTPSQLVNVAGTLFFTASDGIHGTELWKSDGTSRGTRMVRNIRAGSASASPLELTAVAGTLFFTAKDGVHGRELWKSDGTSAGTVMVRNITPGANGSALSQLTRVGHRVFFYRTLRVGDDMTRHPIDDVWMSDGTRDGTRRVFHTMDELSPPAAVGTRLFFGVVHGGTGALWQTDGTVTRRVQGIPWGGEFDNLTAVGSVLYFVMSNVNESYSLWRTDGTQAGTTRLIGVNGLGTTVARFGLGLAFVRGQSWHQLWMTDGTKAGTHQISDVGPSGDASWIEMVAIGNELIFTTASDEGPSHLWRTDGTSAGTELIKEGAGWDLTRLGAVLCYVADDQVWMTDGTAAGTNLVSTFGAGAAPWSLTTVGGRLFFTARDGVHGRELWSYVP
jgi:ELWxxDGT repeat protein